MLGIDAENKRLKDNIITACRALIEFGTPYETNPEFWWADMIFAMECTNVLF